MAANISPLKISEELQLRLAKTLYAEDGDGGSADAFCASSASDLGTLPKVNFGGTGNGFERRRRNRLRSEEGYTPFRGTDRDVADRGVVDGAQKGLRLNGGDPKYKHSMTAAVKAGMRNNARCARDKEGAKWENYKDSVINGFLQKACEWGYIDEDVTPQQDNGGTENGEEGVEERYSGAVRKINALYGGIGEARESSYMVSWLDPRVVDNDALHKDQKALGNGQHYVLFKEKEKASDFYVGLRDKGIDNLKIDALG
jgi:hypothetical protein